jgi:hypothetical protein
MVPLQKEIQMERPMDGLLRTIALPNTENIHFLDLENLLGTGLFHELDVQKIRTEYVSKVGANADDLFFIATGPQNRNSVVNGWSWGNAFFQFPKGKDGADLALVAVFEAIQEPEFFRNIYVGSGDFLLSKITQKATLRNIPVTVVTGKGAQSKFLKGYKTIQLGGI